jgi:hypothetical protein
MSIPFLKMQYLLPIIIKPTFDLIKDVDDDDDDDDEDN